MKDLRTANIKAVRAKHVTILSQNLFVILVKLVQKVLKKELKQTCRWWN